MIKDFRGAWDTACKKSKLERNLCHGFKRAAVRNMMQAGVSERVAMMISGLKTRSVFERYNIVNENDLRQASKKITEYHQDKAVAQNGHNLGTVEVEQEIMVLGDRPITHY